MTDFTPRGYAEFLALAEAAPVYVGGTTPIAPAVTTTPLAPAPPVAGGPKPIEAARALAIATSIAPPAGDGMPTAAQIKQSETFRERELLESIQLVVLGNIGYGKVKVFSRYHRATEIISGVSRMKYEDLLQIAGAPVRSRVHDSEGSDTPTGMHSLKDVKRAIAMMAGFRVINEGGEVGSGCWAGLSEDGKTHDSVVIVGNSEAADWNGDKTLRRVEEPLSRGRLLNFDQRDDNWYDFDKLRGLMQQASDPAFRTSAMLDCIKLLQKWHWKHQTNDPIILTGLVFASWVQTLWEWRPMVSVIGPTSSGKSMFCAAVKGLFGPLGKSCSDQTAAGVRQMIEASARIFMLDEFDSEDKNKTEELHRTLKMLRASGRGDAIVRGTAGQKAHEFNLRHIVWVLGIQISSPRQADRNRFISAELLPPTEELKGKLTIPDQSAMTDLGQRMLASAIWCIHDARKLALKIKDTRVPGVDDRVVESHAVPAAMLACIQGKDEAEARELLKLMLVPLSKEETTGGTDEQSLMTDILGAHVQIGSLRHSVAQLIENVIKNGTGSEEHKESLESRGLKIDRFTGREGGGVLAGEPCFLIAHNMVAEHLIKNTKWGGQAIEQILKRLKGAAYTRRRVGGQKAYVVGIPLQSLVSDYMGLDDGTLLAAAGASGNGGFA